MDWRLKVVAFWVFQTVPFGRKLHYFAQRRITGRLARARGADAHSVRHFVRHLKVFQAARGNLAGQTSTCFEFGAGWDLLSNLVMWCGGINEQKVFDLTPHLRPELVNGCIRALASLDEPALVRRPHALLTEDYRSDLAASYGIEYCAPADARRTGLPAASIDFIASTNTMEHIPPADLRLILRECRRLSHDGTILSFIIDYSDHYSHTDPRLTPYNFLKFGETAWKFLNPHNHYQNRMRNPQFREMLVEEGFAIVEERPAIPGNGLEQIKSLPLAGEFRRFRAEDLAVTSCHFILKPAGEA